MVKVRKMIVHKNQLAGFVGSLVGKFYNIKIRGPGSKEHREEDLGPDSYLVSYWGSVEAET